MLITKNGISRNIDDKDFYKFKEKGYTVVETDKKPLPKTDKKPSKPEEPPKEV